MPFSAVTSCLVAIPIIASLLAGFALRTGKFMIARIESIYGVIGMFVFAILLFGTMTDAGMLKPFIAWLLRVISRKPSRIVPGTALLALPVHLDGSGAVTFLVTIPFLFAASILMTITAVLLRIVPL